MIRKFRARRGLQRIKLNVAAADIPAVNTRLHKAGEQDSNATTVYLRTEYFQEDTDAPDTPPGGEVAREGVFPKVSF